MLRVDIGRLEIGVTRVDRSLAITAQTLRWHTQPDLDVFICGETYFLIDRRVSHVLCRTNEEEIRSLSLGQ